MSLDAIPLHGWIQSPLTCIVFELSNCECAFRI